MRLAVRRMVAVLVLAHATGGCSQSASLESERAKLQGTWVVVAAERRGIANPGYIGLRYQFAGDRVRVISETITGTWTQYTLDLNALPRRIDWPSVPVVAANATMAKSPGYIYRVEDGHLRICWPMDGSERPEAFSSKPDNVLLTLNRVPDANADGEQARSEAPAKRTQGGAWQRLEPWVSVKSQGKYDVDFHGWMESSWHRTRPRGTLKFPAKIGEEQWQDLLALRDIRLLGLRGRSGVGDEQMRHVGQLTSLEAIDLHSTDVGDAGVAQLIGLGNLAQLDLSFTAITDGGLTSVRRMARLKKLILQGTLTTEKGIGDLRAASKDLQIDWPRPYNATQREAAVSLSRLGLEIDDKVDPDTKAATCEIAIPTSIAIREPVVATKTGEKPRLPRTSVAILDAAVVAGYLEKLPAPTSVDAKNEYTDDSIARCLREIHGLVQLNLRKSRITDTGVVELLRHKDLKVLDLSYSKSVTDKAVAGLGSLPNLERLYLSGIDVTPTGLSPLVTLRHLKALAIDRKALNHDLNWRFRQKGVELRLD